mmetsp:Transcript_54855/g.130257  ORF Transcript_54855/g.130257 Transcript_54855/m.130257 type:complete len:167 (-) Transcript_54855:44-544(-)
MGQRGAMLDELYGSLKDLSIEDLKGMLVDDVKLQSYFEANIPSVKEKQELVRQIRTSNIASARSNIDAKTQLDKLESEVEQLREIVAERQTQMVSIVCKIQEASSINSHENVVERLKVDLEECDDESHACANATTSETNWGKFTEEFVAKRKAVHLKEELLERLTL